MSEELNDGVIFTPKLEEEGRIDEFPEPKTLAEEIEAEVQEELKNEGATEGAVEEISAEDLNKKSYVKITPTLYIKPFVSDEVNDKGEKKELYKILNPETLVVETRELTDEEKREIQIQQLKESKVKFHPLKHGVKSTVVVTEVLDVLGRKKKRKDNTVLTNVTINQFGAAYKQKRKRKNRLQKASRKANR